MVYALAVLVAFFASAGHILFKIFALKRELSFTDSLLDWHLIAGVALFGSSVILTIISLLFIDFSAFYSFTALNYLFISGLSKKFLGEKFDKKKILGNVIIVLGILIYNL